MKIEEVSIYKIRLPFRTNFTHALARSAFAENVVVEMRGGAERMIGYGESAPRLYVTGENADSALKTIEGFLNEKTFPRDLREVSQVWDFVDHLPDVKDQNAAICALETALFDALSSVQGRSLMEYFPHDHLSESIHYGAAIPIDKPEKITEICRAVKKKGIRRLKVKMGRDFQQNKQILEAVQRIFGHECDLKIDVNGAWHLESALENLPLIEFYKVKVVEQPMIPGDADIVDFAKRVKASGVKLMADESACCLSEVAKVVHEGHYNMINVRLSKCGGFTRSLRIVNYLRKKRIPFQIGCQLGESGILSAAGRTLSLLCSDAVYHDGSYDEFLLAENITESHVSFGQNGIAGPLGGVGLGVKVNRENLERMSEASKRVRFRR
jgi:L-alanine-DL-glutamate epimerase-like enolase superfamily enzyme